MNEIIVLTRNELQEVIRESVRLASQDLIREIKSQVTCEIMTKAQVAEYLQCSISTINYQIQRNKLPVERIGDTPRFRKASIDLWLKSGTPA